MNEDKKKKIDFVVYLLFRSKANISMQWDFKLSVCMSLDLMSFSNSFKTNKKYSLKGMNLTRRKKQLHNSLIAGKINS